MKKLLFAFMLIGIAWSTYHMVETRDLIGVLLCGTAWGASIILAATGALR